VALNYALIFGHFGLPQLGAVGCGLSSLVVWWTLCLMGWTYTHLDPGYRRFTIALARPRGTALLEHLQLGVPIGLSYTFEVTSFSFMAILIAPLGTSVMGGHHSSSNLAGMSYQIPLLLTLAPAIAT